MMQKLEPTKEPVWKPIIDGGLTKALAEYESKLRSLSSVDFQSQAVQAFY